MLPLRTVTLHPSPQSHERCHPVLYTSRTTSSSHLVVLSFKGRADLIHYWNKLMGCGGFNPGFWCQSARFCLVSHLLAVSPTLLNKMRIGYGLPLARSVEYFMSYFRKRTQRCFWKGCHAPHVSFMITASTQQGQGYCASRDELFLVHLLKHKLRLTLKMPSFFSALL